MSIFRPTKQMVRQMRRDNAGYPPTLTPIPRETWPNTPTHRPRIAVWRSRDFLVQAFEEEKGIVRLSVCRTDWDFNKNCWREDIGWEDLQTLKSQAGFSHHDAVEVFPADKDVVNVANMRHLFILPKPLPFAWRAGTIDGPTPPQNQGGGNG